MDQQSVAFTNARNARNARNAHDRANEITDDYNRLAAKHKTLVSQWNDLLSKYETLEKRHTAANERINSLQNAENDLVKKLDPVEDKLWGFHPELLIPKDGKNFLLPQREDIMLFIAQEAINDGVEFLMENEKLLAFIEASGLKLDRKQYQVEQDEISERKIEHLLGSLDNDDYSEGQKKWIKKSVDVESDALKARILEREEKARARVTLSDALDKKAELLKQLLPLQNDYDEKDARYKEIESAIIAETSPLEKEIAAATKEQARLERRVSDAYELVTVSDVKKHWLSAKADIVIYSSEHSLELGNKVDRTVHTTYDNKELAHTALKGFKTQYESDKVELEKLKSGIRELNAHIEKLKATGLNSPEYIRSVVAFQKLNTGKSRMRNIETIIHDSSAIAD